MFEDHSADTHAGKFPIVLMGGRAEGLACADPGARTPIGASGNYTFFLFLKKTKRPHMSAASRVEQLYMNQIGFSNLN